MADYNIIIEEPVTQIVVIETPAPTQIIISETIQETVINVGTGGGGDIGDVQVLLDQKQDKEVGKGLSQENYTTTEKNKLAGIEPNAQVNVNADWDAVSGAAEVLNKPVFPDELSDLAEDPNHRTVTDGEKSTWNGKQNALGFDPVPNTLQINGHTLESSIMLTKSDIGLPLVDNTSDTGKPVSTPQQNALNLKESLSNKVTDFTTANNTLYPSVLAVKTFVEGIVSGAIVLQGDWNASTNTPDITGTTITGHAWRVNTAGSTDLGGITTWLVGDLAIKAATGWTRVIAGDIAALWGNIDGNIEDQPDLIAALDLKQDTSPGLGLSQESYTTTEKSKLAGVASGATANSSDATLLNRANHTGVQAATTITEDSTHRFATDAEKTSWNAKQAGSNKLTEISGLTLSNNDIIQQITGVLTNRTPAQLKTSLALVKADVGLANVPNLDTSTTANISPSANKNFVTDAQATVIGNTSGTNAGDQTFTPNAGGDVTGGSSGNPIAPTLTIGNSKVTNAKLAAMPGLSLKGNDQVGSANAADLSTTAARTLLSVNNTDNTSDLNKPISSATQTALDGKQPIDTDLTAIGNLSTVTPGMIATDGGGWIFKAYSAVKTALGVQEPVLFRDEGVALGAGGTVDEIDFTGAITASRLGNKVTVNVTAGSGTFSINTVEKDLGSTARRGGSFDITGLSGLNTNAPVMIQQAAGPYTGKGTLEDEAEMDQVQVTAYVLNATTIRAYWQSMGQIIGNIKFNYTTA